MTAQKENQPDIDHWSLDKRIPLGLLMGLALQTIIFSFWMGMLSTQVSQNTTNLRDKQSDAPRLAIIETRVSTLDSSINRLTNTIDRLLRDNSEKK